MIELRTFIRRNFLLIGLLTVALVVIAILVNHAVAGEDGCTQTSADGTSTLHVSQRALDNLREHGWEATDETGRLVCK